MNAGDRFYYCPECKKFQQGMVESVLGNGGNVNVSDKS